MFLPNGLRLVSSSGYSSTGVDTPVREASASYPPLSTMQQQGSSAALELQLQALQQQLNLQRSASPGTPMQAGNRPSFEVSTPVQATSGARVLSNGSFPVQVLLVAKDPILAAIFQQALSQAPIPSVLHIAAATDMWAMVDQIKTESGRPQGPEFVFFQPEMLVASPGAVLRLKQACGGAVTAVVLQANDSIARALQADDFLPGPTPAHPLRKEDLSLTLLKWRTRQQSSSTSSAASSGPFAGSGGAAGPTAAMAQMASPAMAAVRTKQQQQQPLQQQLTGGLGYVKGPSGGATQQQQQQQQPQGSLQLPGVGMAQLQQLQAQLQQLQQAKQQQQQQQQQRLLMPARSQFSAQQQPKPQQLQQQQLLGTPGSTTRPPSSSIGSTAGETGAAGSAAAAPSTATSPTAQRPPPLRLQSAGISPADALPGSAPTTSRPYDNSFGNGSTAAPAAVAVGPGGNASSVGRSGASNVSELAAQVAELRRKLEGAAGAGKGAGAGAGMGAVTPGAVKLGAPGLAGGAGGAGAGGSAVAGGAAAGMFSQQLPAMPALGLQQQQQQQQLQQLQQMQQQMQQMQQKGAGLGGGQVGGSVLASPHVDASAAASPTAVGMGAAGVGASGVAAMGGSAGAAAVNPSVRKLGLQSYGSLVRPVGGGPWSLPATPRVGAGGSETTHMPPSVQQPQQQPQQLGVSSFTASQASSNSLQLQQQLLHLQRLQQQIQEQLQSQQSQQQQRQAAPALVAAPSMGRSSPTPQPSVSDAQFAARHTYPNASGSLPILPYPPGGASAANDGRRSSTSPGGSVGGSSTVSRSNSFVAAGGARYRPPRPRSPSPLGGSSSGFISDGYAGSGTSRFAASPYRSGSRSDVGPSLGLGGGGGGGSGAGGSARSTGSGALSTARSGDDAIAAALMAVVSDSEEGDATAAPPPSPSGGTPRGVGSRGGSATAGDAGGGARGSVSDMGRLEAQADGGSSVDGRSVMEASFAMDESGCGGRDSLSGGCASSIDFQPNPGLRVGVPGQQQQQQQQQRQESPRANLGGTRVGSHRLSTATVLSEHTDDESSAAPVQQKPAAATAIKAADDEDALFSRRGAERSVHGNGSGGTARNGSTSSDVAGGAAAAAAAAGTSRQHTSSSSARDAAASAPAAESSASAADAFMLVPHKPPLHLQLQIQQQMQQRRGADGDGEVSCEDSDSMDWWSPAPSTSDFRPTLDGGAPLLRSADDCRMPTIHSQPGVAEPDSSRGSGGAAPANRPPARVDSQGSIVPSIDGTQPIAAADGVGAGAGASQALLRAGGGSAGRQAMASRLGPIGEVPGSDWASGSAISAGSASLAPAGGNVVVAGGGSSPGSAYTDDIFAAVHQAYERATGSPAPMPPPRPSTPPARRAARILLSSHPIVITRDDFLPQ